MNEPSIVKIAALIGDQARACALTALMSNRALTATELANLANVSKQTMSAHLTKLLEANLLAVEQQGRHRYFRLASPAIAQLLENLMNVAQDTGAHTLRTGPRAPALRRARVCYDHLAGELGVLMYDSMLQHGLLNTDSGKPELSAKGWAWCEQLGLDQTTLQQQKRILCRPCLDWSERRHHLAGGLGSALLQHYLGQGWARREEGSRIISFSAEGERRFQECLVHMANPGSGKRNA